MGWWPGSTPPKPAETAPEPSSTSRPTSTLQPASQQISPSTTPGVPPTAQQSEDPELRELFSSLTAPSSSDKTTTSTHHDQQSSTTLPNAIPLPTTLVCHTLFDTAYHCSSLGGQLNNVYRYGSMRDCSAQWSAFWFCMRTRTYGTQARADAVRAWYREKEGLVKQGPCADDIWEERSSGEREALVGAWMARDPDVDFGLGRRGGEGREGAG